MVVIGKDIIYLWSPSRRYTAKPVLRDHYRDKEKMSLYDGVIRIRKSKDRQHNGQKKRDKRTNNDLQAMHIKIRIE
jgi:hypothetical protein